MPVFKLWIATNDPPEFSGGDYSIARRIQLVQFPVTFEEGEQDHDLPNRLLGEASGILNWGLRGYDEWKEQGLNPPDRIKVATKNYRVENDPVGQFIEACCIEEPTAQTTIKELHDVYKLWCFNSGFEPVASNILGRELDVEGFAQFQADLGTRGKV